MTVSPFVHKPLEHENFILKLFGVRNKRNAFIAMNNLLADVGRMTELQGSDLRKIFAEYKIDPRSAFPGETLALYQAFLAAVVSDDRADQDEHADLQALQVFLGITDAQHDVCYTKAGCDRYAAAIRKALIDGRLTSGEKAMLDRVATTFELSPKAKKATYNETVSSFLISKFHAAISDGILTPEEDAGLEHLIRDVGASVEIDDGARKAMERGRLAWRFSQGPLRTIQADIRLPAGEECYWSCHMGWNETRKDRRTGCDYLQQIDTGMCYVTNKRVIFDGTFKNTSIKLQKLMGFKTYSDGIMLEKDSGKSPILTCGRSDAELCSLLLDRLLHDLGIR